MPTDPPRGARRLTARPADPQGLGQPRGGGGVPPPPSEGGGVPPPPYSPPNCRTPLGVTHWLAAAPVVTRYILHMQINLASIVRGYAYKGHAKAWWWPPLRTTVIGAAKGHLLPVSLHPLRGGQGIQDGLWAGSCCARGVLKGRDFFFFFAKDSP